MVDTSKWENDGHWNSGDLFQTKPYLEFNLEKPPKPKQFFLTILKSNRRYRTQKLKFLKLYHRFFHSNNTVYESTVPHQPHVVSNKPPNLPTSPVPPPLAPVHSTMPPPPLAMGAAAATGAAFILSS